MKFLRAVLTDLVDLPDSAEVSVTDKQKDIIERNALGFLRAGGSLTIEDWAEFNIVEREAFTVAGEKMRAEQSFNTGTASRSAVGAAHVYKAVDGGNAYVQMCLEGMADNICGKYGLALDGTYNG